jgi:hypothetical protein
MANNPHPQRRDFLKTAAAGAAGAMGISAFKFDKLFAQSTGGGWVTGMQINPAIDNKRVICCHDPLMLGNYPAAGSAVSALFTNQNLYVTPAVVSTNMDEMAMQLAQKTSAADAWSTIFRTGNSGGWGSTRVAIKVNGINGDIPTKDTINRPRVAVVKKICDVLVDQLGVKPANIVLYDACDDASKPYGPYVDANDSTGTKIRAAPVSVRAAGLGGFQAVTLANWDPGTKNANGSASCPADLVNAKIDILVNIAVAKMHDGPGGSYGYGSVTLCMKNHLGTFTDSGKGQHSGGLHSLKAQLEINQHAAVLGGNPVRQQLCIVDALLSNGASGPGKSADNRTDRLVMGTFAPFVDYFTANYILFDPTIMAASPIPQQGLTAAATLIPQFATALGYPARGAAPAPPDPGWVSYPASSPPPINPSGTGGTSGSGGAGSGGTKASGGASGSGGTASGGTKGAGSGGTSGSGGAGTGGTSVGSGGTSGSGGAASGGSKASGGAGSGGTGAAGGASSSGGTVSASGGAGATGGTTSSASASGGSARTGGTTAGNGTGGSSGSAGSTAKSENSESGCDVAGVDRRATRWGAMFAFGAVVAEKLRRLVSGDKDRSS